MYLKLRDRASYEFALASAALVRGRPDEAITRLEAARTIDPTDVRILIDLGRVYRSVGQRSAALEAFSAAAELDPLEALPELAAEHRAMGEPAKALEALVKTIEIEPQHFGARLQLVELSRTSRAYEACLELCDTLIAAFPDRIELD